MLSGFNAYSGILTVLSFIFSLVAALLATDMYRLLRTGEVGRSWRILIIASVISVVLQALRLVEFINGQEPQRMALSHIVELFFVLALAYAFYLQRAMFSHAAKERSRLRDSDDEDGDIDLPSIGSSHGTANKARGGKWSALTP